MGKKKDKIQPTMGVGQRRISSYFSVGVSSQPSTCQRDGVATIDNKNATSALKKPTLSHGKSKDDVSSRVSKDLSNKSDNSNSNIIHGRSMGCLSKEPEETEVTYNKSVKSSPTSSHRKSKSCMGKEITIKSDKRSNESIPDSLNEAQNSDLDIESDSDSEIIPCTPKEKIQGKERTHILNRELSYSPDIIPSTPQTQTSKSILSCSKSEMKVNNDLFISASNSMNSNKSNILKNDLASRSKIANKKCLESKKNKNSPKLSLKGRRDPNGSSFSAFVSSVKRPALTGTGISPDAKRIPASNKLAIPVDKNLCKLDLMQKLSQSGSVKHTHNSTGTGKQSSISEFGQKNNQTYERKLPDCEVAKYITVINDKENESSATTEKGLVPKCDDEGISDLSEQEDETLPKLSRHCDNSSQVFSVNDDHNDGKHSNVLKHCNDSSEEFVLSQDIAVSDDEFNENRKKVMPNHNSDTEDNLITEDDNDEKPSTDMDSMLEDSLDHLFTDDLSIGIEKLSPFKKPPKDHPEKPSRPQNLDNMLEDSLDYLFNDELSVGLEKLSPFKQPSKEDPPEKSSIARNLENMLEDSLDHLFNDDSSMGLENLSPFKKPPKEDPPENKQLKKLLSEGVGAESYCQQGNYGRHVVTRIDRDPYKRELFLHLLDLHDQTPKTCTLSGFWNESIIGEGDVVHILFTEPVDGHFILDNNKGLIVINPDFLVSGTSVVSGVFCRRKAVLNERFKGIDSGNQIMLIGSLVHQFFQEVVTKKIQKYNELEDLMRKLISSSRAVHDMYGLGISQEKIMEEMTGFLPHIHTWSQKYLGNLTPFSSNSKNGRLQVKEHRRNQWDGKITEILDIEENLWSPRFGLKGKIDMTVRIHHRGKTKVLPLELKTGRSSFSAEHRGQVTLYSMMSADRRPDPQAGLLLYLKNGAMEEVSAGEKEQRGLLQLRNELVHHLTVKPTLQPGDSVHQLPSLPEPIDFERACVKCAHLVTCSVYQAGVEKKVPMEPHPMATLVPASIAHLKESHLEYFRHWCLLLHLEMTKSRKDSAVRALWSQNPLKREGNGDCLSDLVVDETVAVSEIQPGIFRQVLRRTHTHPSFTSLSSIGLLAGDNIIVSSKTEIALSMGVVVSIQEATIEIIIDRDLRQYPRWQEKVFHVDRYEYQSTMGINFGNLAQLLMDGPNVAHLRTLIIDKEPPNFKKGLPPDVVLKGKHILKSLNKTQQRAVLKTLMAESFSLLKGYPGTGKTSTIVAMVRLMVSLGLSVLITSYTHSAVDNILLKLKEHEMDFLRLGRTTRIHTDLLPYADEVVTRKICDVPSLEQFYGSKLVVATTCLGVNHVIFTKRRFDYCIVDEATQVLQPAALGPLFHASHFVLVGDPQQLPPLVQSKQARTLGMSESLFMRLDSKEATSDLHEQYRMNGPIMRLANELVYNNRLQCANAAVENATLVLPNYTKLVTDDCMSCWLQTILDPSLERAVIFVDTCGTAAEGRDRANQVINKRETELVALILFTLIKAGMAACDIGIITPYRAQVKLLRSWLCRDEAQNMKQVEVNTVDQYQGRDKSVMLYCCVRSGSSNTDPEDILQDERRLNVALTRAKHKLIIVGDRASLQSYEPFRKVTALLHCHQFYRLQDGKEGFAWQDSVSF